MLRRSSSATKILKKGSTSRLAKGNSLISKGIVKREKAYARVTEKTPVNLIFDKNSEFIRDHNIDYTDKNIRKNTVFAMSLNRQFKIFFLNKTGTGNKLSENFMQDIESHLKVELTS